MGMIRYKERKQGGGLKKNTQPGSEEMIRNEETCIFFREKGTSLVGGYCVMTIQIRPLGEYPSDQGGESTKKIIHC